MARFNRLKRNGEDETELNIVPIMNMFMVLIPFLLMSASFFDIKAINTSVPIHSDKMVSEKQEPKLKTLKLTVILELKEDQIKLSALSDTLDEAELAKIETDFPRSAGQSLSVALIGDYLKKVKTQYPDSDTILLIPDDNVSYDEIIQAMDCARKYKEEILFPNVVLSGSLG